MIEVYISSFCKSSISILRTFSRGSISAEKNVISIGLIACLVLKHSHQDQIPLPPSWIFYPPCPSLSYHGRQGQGGCCRRGRPHQEPDHSGCAFCGLPLPYQGKLLESTSRLLSATPRCLANTLGYLGYLLLSVPSFSMVRPFSQSQC